MLQKKVGIVGKVVQQLGIVRISGTATYVFDWTEAPANSIEPELPELGSQLVHLMKLYKLAKTPLECFQLFLSLHWSAYL